MADYVASRVTPKQLPLPAHATTLDNLPRMGTKVNLGAASTADAATVLQAVQAVLADVLGTFVLPDQPLMQVRYRCNAIVAGRCKQHVLIEQIWHRLLH